MSVDYKQRTALDLAKLRQMEGLEDDHLADWFATIRALERAQGIKRTLGCDNPNNQLELGERYSEGSEKRKEYDANKNIPDLFLDGYEYIGNLIN